MENNKISIIGLGYVGLPLAVLFAKKYKVVGYDINSNRIDELNNFIDSTNEIESSKLKEALKKDKNYGLKVSSNKNELKNSDYFIITVPTPIDKNYKPDLSPLLNASELVGSMLTKNATVIYESTVYPGATEQDLCSYFRKKILNEI